MDVRIAGGRIAAIGRELGAGPALEARGGLLLPGLHDHHLHLAAAAAAMSSVRCGPPEVNDAAALAAALSASGEGWLRGIGYHESVAGEIDRAWLDRHAPDRPVRVQHRGGRMWVFNSAGLARLLAGEHAPPTALDRASGRLFDADAWLRDALGGVPPAFDAVGAALARHGITGVTEMTPANDAATARHLARERARGALPQRVLLAGRSDLSDAPLPEGIALGPVKLHLHEARLPDYDATIATIRAAHERARAVAVHCVTAVELVFALAALREAGAAAGDRIEHASVATDDMIAQFAALGIAVCVQPNFVRERGDAYRAAIPRGEWPDLYRLRAFATAGVALAGGSDAPFGVPDPWAAMAAAVDRRTRDGAWLGAVEALTPEAALDLFLADPHDFSRARELAVGMRADLCLLDRPWTAARASLSARHVRATIIDGRVVHAGLVEDRVDEAPVAREPRADTLARQHQ